MIQQTLEAERFKEQMRDSLRRETLNSRAVTIRRHANIYSCGDQDEMVYFIEAGQIKLLLLSPEGRECLLAIHGSGDIFGELCLAGLGARHESAVAMQQSTIKQIPCSQFFARLSRESLLEGFVRYLAVRVADQQRVIANLVMVDSEQRLGQTLLQLARTMGKKDPRSIRIELKISHEELSEMVGTTRPRISVFMQRFRNLGLIETNSDHFLIIKESRLSAYLAEIA
ncbi:MAG TPA: Crp/Fnr family transcriptional regulator [Terriglobales bacterium]|jgi:CRP-like cAMP-binding protein|nr:Crp/Fnr family transcriptional regulator [Terriglobales bacterium]